MKLYRLLLADRFCGLQEQDIMKTLNWTYYVHTQASASLESYPDAAHVRADDLGHLAALVSCMQGLLACSVPLR